jgi:D-threo-aldose 1-dehydrogenase
MHCQMNTSLPENKATTATLHLPPVVFGTSGLGNLFVALEEEEKQHIISECVRLSKGKVVFDAAGKYGAGLALESLGKCLKQLHVEPGNVVISNKLGWVRTKLKTKEPTFEPGVWKNIKYDAVQKIGYDGMIESFEQGNELLNGYFPQMVSVQDPDEYMAIANSYPHSQKLYEDILDAYEALYDLKKQGKVQFIGVAAKNWKIIQRIAKDVDLDWIMIANCMTIKSHPQELLDFIVEMEKKGVYVINSAVFHSGFLTGGDYFDNRLIERGDLQNEALYTWRSAFFETCNQFNVKPAEACVQFALNVPGVKSIALNTTHTKRGVKDNIDMANAIIPAPFWKQMKAMKLIEVDCHQWLPQI